MAREILQPYRWVYERDGRVVPFDKRQCQLLEERLLDANARRPRKKVVADDMHGVVELTDARNYSFSVEGKKGAFKVRRVLARSLLDRPLPPNAPRPSATERDLVLPNKPVISVISGARLPSGDATALQYLISSYPLVIFNF